MKQLLVLLLVVLSVPAFSQTISGYVYDEAENKPLEGAFVYLDGTTLSASTDANGFFRINAGQKYNSALIITFIGFETLRVEDPFGYGKPFKALLREDAISLNEVVINKKKGPFSRREMMRVFRDEFLGKSKAGSSCKIENEQDIILYYDPDDNTLHAEATKPLRIINDCLQYKIIFDLAGFAVSYKVKSLSPLYMSRSYFAGTTFFTDIAKKKEKAEKIRKETYLGSTVHLMKTIVAEDWQKQKFGFYTGSFPDNPKEYFAVSDSLNYKKVTLLKVPEASSAEKNIFINGPKPDAQHKFRGVSFNILYDKKEQSSFSFNKGYFYVDGNGLFFPINELTFGGYMAGMKAGDLLPADYEYKE
ncbi:carboxypeptidase-like regulatory domain-containing protein [Flavobacterium sp. DGU11]|uniref:Carboxypeptidase-like regulatory domain-containing protein n=1 Tax=Flavobacterium arundinis TaxID=3139143 RepID=A0ABU9I0W4_9FLAO